MRRLITLAATSAVMLAAASPAFATTSGHGSLEGNATVSPSPSATTCHATRYTFRASSIIGVVTVDGAEFDLGPGLDSATATASGYSACATTVSANGTISATVTAQDYGLIISLSHTDLSCSLSGTFKQVGSAVDATLPGTCTVTTYPFLGSPSSYSSHANFTIAGTLVPTSTGSPSTGVFVGAYNA